MADQIVTAPLVVAAMADGTRRYLYTGEKLPAASDLAPGEADRLIGLGVTADAPEVVVVTEVVETTAPPAPTPADVAAAAEEGVAAPAEAEAPASTSTRRKSPAKPAD